MTALATIKVDPSPSDFTQRALRAQFLISMVQTELIRMVQEAAENSHEIDRDELLSTIDAYLTDLVGDLSGAFEKAAQQITDDRYEGCARGPMYRRR